MIASWQITSPAKNEKLDAFLFAALQQNVQQPECKRSGSNGTIECQSVNAFAAVFFGNKSKHGEAGKYRQGDNYNCFHSHVSGFQPDSTLLSKPD